MQEKQGKDVHKGNTITAVLTVPELAQLLKIGRTTAYALCRNGEITSVRIGRAIRIPVSAVERFLKNKGAVN